MIEFDHVTFSYASQPVLCDVNLRIGEGRLALLTGRTGSGKSTLLGLVNGHVPHFTGGTLTGHVRLSGIDTGDVRPRDLAETVGVVFQDPAASFVADTVEDELAFGLEQLGVRPQTMRTRVEDALDLASIADLRARAPQTLSGGQQQRVAIAAVLAAGARVLVLDEPTSALDPTSAEEVLAALQRLVHDIGLTVLIAEHRLERVLEYADTVIALDDAGHATQASPAVAMQASPLAPPVVELGRLLGWRPLALSIRDARSRACPELDAAPWAAQSESLLQYHVPATVHRDGRSSNPICCDGPPVHGQDLVSEAHPARHVLARSSILQQAPDTRGLAIVKLRVSYGATVAVRDVSLDLPTGQVTALMGRNGSGKSSLLWALTGVGPHQGGRWALGQRDLSQASPAIVRRLIRLVPQTAADLLYLSSVEAELARADSSNSRPPGTARILLDELAPGVAGATHPRDLSEGQQLALVLATQLTGDPSVVLLDEPTRGLDYPAKAALTAYLRRLAQAGKAVCVATHDVEFAAAVADRVAVMATGEVIATGPVGQVLTSTVTFAPQVAKITKRWLTVSQVADALERARRGKPLPDRPFSLLASRSGMGLAPHHPHSAPNTPTQSSPQAAIPPIGHGTTGTP